MLFCFDLSYVFALKNNHVFSFSFIHPSSSPMLITPISFVCVWSSTKMMIVKGACVFFSLETDEQVRAFAEKVFASETKDEDIREEVSLFGVADCPILNQELEHHLTVDDDIERR